MHQHALPTNRTRSASTSEARPALEAVSHVGSDPMAGPLLRRVGRALAKPGLPREAVFGLNPSRNFFAYALDPSNPSRMVREDATGNKTVGRMINGVFRKLPSVA